MMERCYIAGGGSEREEGGVEEEEARRGVKRKLEAVVAQINSLRDKLM